MGNTAKGKNDNLFCDETKNNKIVPKNIINYLTKYNLIYEGSKNKTFFFSCEQFYKKKGVYNKFLIVQSQFSVNGQGKILKKWSLQFNEIILMNKSNAFIVLHFLRVYSLEIENSYNLNKNVKTIWTYSGYSFDNYTLPQSNLQLSLMDDQIAMSIFNEQIIVLMKEKEDNWKCCQELNIDFRDFILNEEGNILIIDKKKKNFLTANHYSQSVIYIKNANGQWRLLKEIEIMSNENIWFCFLDNERFVFSSNQSNLITIQQVIPQKLEVIKLQELKFELLTGLLSNYEMNFEKQRKFLIIKGSLYIYFVKMKNKNFYISENKEAQRGEVIQRMKQGILVNFKNIYSVILRNQILNKIQFFKIYVK